MDRTIGEPSEKGQPSLKPLRLPVPVPDSDSPNLQRFQQENASNPEFHPDNFHIQLDRSLGAGGSNATVCEARAKNSNETLACKINNVFRGPEKTRAHAMQEVCIHKQIGNMEHVVKFKGCHVCENGETYLFMEQMSTSLDKLLLAAGEIPESHLSNIALAVIKVMDSLFRQDKPIIHRDIKPANIMMDFHGVVNVGDFGVSRQLNEDSIATTFIGTRIYMSPERILFVREEWLAAMTPESARLANVAGDVWSLGMTLMELALGRFPMPKMSMEQQRAWLKANKTERSRLRYETRNVDSMNEIGYATELKADPPVSDLCSKFSEDFRSFVKACLEVDFKKRPQLHELLEMNFVRRASDSVEPFAQWIAKTVTKCQVH